jgi:hypothetical protein
VKEATKFPRHQNKHSELTVSISFINDLCVNPKPKAVPNPKVQFGLGMSLKSHGPNRKRNYDRGKNKPVLSQHLSVSRLVTCHVLSMRTSQLNWGWPKVKIVIESEIGQKLARPPKNMLGLIWPTIWDHFPKHLINERLLNIC